MHASSIPSPSRASFACRKRQNPIILCLSLDVLAVLHSLVEEGNATAAAAHLKDLSKALRDTQPRNAALALRLCKPISRLACGDTTLLSLTLTILQRVSTTVGGLSQAPVLGGPALGSIETVSELALEIARQQLLSGALPEELHSYSRIPFAQICFYLSFSTLMHATLL
jgi:hypothetical protein